jgi:hypothetical protein
MVSLSVLSAMAFTSRESLAATCTYVTTGDQFDNFYMSGWGCNQAAINDMWSRFAFHKDDWDEGFGYEAPCDNARPLARTFNALQLLAYSHTNAPTCTTTGSNVLDWAYCWAGDNLDELDGRCGSGNLVDGGRAYTQGGPVIDNYTELYWKFFYGETVVQRAGTIFHEARHMDACLHNGNGGCPSGGDSCDREYNGGCLGWWSGKGANAYTVLYSWWFASTAVWVAPGAKANAVSEANNYLAKKFNTNPCFRINSAGASYSVC